MTEARLTFDVSPEARQALRGLEKYLAGCGLPASLLELVKLRVSSINGCAFCIDRHWRALRGEGEPEARLYALSAWREQEGYSPRERAALGWAESLTTVATSGAPDALYAEVSAHFTPKELADLTYAIAAINAWNRLCVAFRIPPEHPLPERRS
jgi:AhpD family alkylhydroperoxidase